MAGLNSARWAELLPQVDELLTLDVAAREHRLNEIAANDPATAGQLRSLLEARDAASRASFLSGVADRAVLPPSVAPGDMLGAWTLVDVIGEGGMGSVWRARRSDGRFEGEAAIKLLRNGVFDAGAQERFRREGAILARLRHPGIAQLLDAGVTERGQPYLVLEFVKGERIDRWCAARSLGIRARVILFAQVLEAVSAAHSQLVVHRDLKPSNILVDDTGRVRLLDFGIAQLQSADAGPGLTREGALALTPEYAAPEQFTGGVISMATDVFALGVVLYELLAGVHPSGLQGAPALAYLKVANEGRFKLASEIATEVATQVATQRELRGDLDNILARALRAAPAERYPSVAALGDDLRHFLAHEPVSARPDALAYRVSKFVQRHRLGTALAAVAVLAIAAGLVGTLVQSNKALQAAAQSELERQSALRELHYAEATKEFVVFLLSESGGKPMTVAELMQHAEGLVEKQFGHDPGVRARLQLLIADRYGNLEQVEKSLALLQQSQQSAKEAGEPVLGAEAQCTEAVMRASAGDAEAAQALFKAALGTLRASGPSATKPLAECLVFVSEAESGYWGMPAEAVTHGEEALTLFQGLPDVKGEPMVNVRSALAGAYGTLGRSHDAVVAYAQTLDALAALGREKSVDAMSSLQSMAVFQSRGGQTVSAIQSYERALEIAGGLQDSAPSMPSLEANYAKALTDAGRVAEALPIFERTLGNQAVRQNPANLASIELQAATAFCVAGNLNRCEALAQSAFAGLTKTRPPRHPLLGTSCLQRAQLALARGKTEDARQLLEESVAVYMEAKERSPLAIRALVLLARVDQELGKGDEATQRLEQAQAWAEQTSAGYEHSGWLGITALARAQIEQDRADPAEARKALDVALPHLLVSLGEQAPEARLARELVAKSR